MAQAAAGTSPVAEGMAQAAAGTSPVAEGMAQAAAGTSPVAERMAQAATGTSPVAEGMDHVTSIIGAGEHAEVMRRSPTTSSPTLMLVGGGAFCFSFGSVFSGVWTLALSQLSLAAFPQLPCPQRTTPAAAPSSTDVNSNTTGSLDLMKSAVLSDLANLDLDLADPSCTWVIQVQSHLAKGVKDAVKDAGWLDKSKKAGVLKATPAPSTAGHLLLHNGSATNGGNIMDRVTDAGPPCSYVQLPLHSQAVQALKQALMLGTESSSAAQLLVTKALLSGDAKLLISVVTHSTKHIVDPKTLMRTAVINLLLEQQQQVRRTHDEPVAEPGSTKQQLPWPSSRVMDELLEDLPVKWERLGDLALLPEGCLVHRAWSSILPDLGGLWTVMAKALGVRRLAKQAKVANTGAL
ncbi:hypothetical protein CEUSTIGMA_g14072.t1 [Chlamydomonas eustigma]|uniref:Uncharacterized protein n=1 Tax=Chlamydomonas eustigma TaxID=1157962 RepID=A0A250XUD6_9CHLO|nr:hypothetical protein CEUSTIGMA_g14072.t1 [Chlamydomonas eustigma]|eukprot:GAX86664.1 hypothetical protein CEUSTIGMA_g14072.t1 [Chlamydomonas eustigma]